MKNTKPIIKYLKSWGGRSPGSFALLSLDKDHSIGVSGDTIQIFKQMLLDGIDDLSVNGDFRYQIIREPMTTTEKLLQAKQEMDDAQKVLHRSQEQYVKSVEAFVNENVSSDCATFIHGNTLINVDTKARGGYMNYIDFQKVKSV